MENLYLKGLEHRPEVIFIASTGILSIYGQPEQDYPSFKFLNSIIKWLEKYLEKEGREINLHLSLHPLYTSYIHKFLKIIELLEDYYSNKKGQVTIHWHYEKNNLDMLEFGEECAENTTLEFNLIAY
jgi:hypothetical protein